MTGSGVRIWHQSFTVLEKLPDYAAALRAHMGKVARPGTEVVLHGMHPDTYATEYPGTDIRFSYVYQLHAQQFAVNALRAQQEGFDAFAIATLPDPLLRETRSLLDIPVVGYGEAAMHLACLLGQRFGVLVFIDALVPVLEDNARRYGLERRLAGVRHAGFQFGDVAPAFARPGPIVERFQEAARRMIADGADVLIPGEAVLCVLLASQGVNRVDDVPVVDALAATVKMAEALVDLRRVSGLTVSRKSVFTAAPPPGRVKELLRFYGLERFGGSTGE
jgi:Asp/Glu/hydantoin racemase